jgi:hypothetical protein
MSEFGKPKQCNNGCGALIYFDRDSPTGHPSPDKWIPLEIKEGRRTDQPHNCPKKKEANGSNTLETTATATTIPKSELINFAETLSQILHDYARLKRQEVAAVAGGIAK